MSEETIEAKQLFLTEEIIKKGYDAQEFSVFLTEQKGEEKIDLEYWSMEDLKNAVESFKMSLLKKKNEIEKQNDEHYINRRHSSMDLTDSRKNKNDENEKSFGKTMSFRDDVKIEGKHLFKDIGDINEEDDNLDEDGENETKIKCIKLNENEITNREDLYIKINLPEVTKKNILSNFSEIEIETIPIGYKSIRKINDFEYISKKIPLINSEIFNPILYIHKSESTEAISSDTIIFLDLYMNSLIQSPYFRTLPIVYDFLTKNEEEWEKIKNENYNKIKEVNKRNKIPNLDGYFNLEFEAGDDEKCLKINDELNLKKESFNKLNKNIDELLKMYDKVCSTLKNISQSFGELKNRYISSPDIINLFAHLELIVKVWDEGLSRQKKYLKDEFRFLFRYINKENMSFLKYYENFKTSYDDFKSKFDKMSTILYPSKKDKKILKNLQREFSFNLVNVFGEYKKLNDNQAKRIENKLNKANTNRDTLFNHIENIFGLLNFFNIKEKKEKDKDKDKAKDKEKDKEKENEKDNKEKGNNIKENKE